MKKDHLRHYHCFTLIELLVVIAMIAVITNESITANFNNLFN